MLRHFERLKTSGFKYISKIIFEMTAKNFWILSSRYCSEISKFTQFWNSNFAILKIWVKLICNMSIWQNG